MLPLYYLYLAFPFIVYTEELSHKEYCINPSEKGTKGRMETSNEKSHMIYDVEKSNVWFHVCYVVNSMGWVNQCQNNL